MAVNATTTVGDTTTDPATDRHGNVGPSGDIVDALAAKLPTTPSMRAMARERRLAAAICGATPEIERMQLARIKGTLERFPA